MKLYFHTNGLIREVVLLLVLQTLSHTVPAQGTRPNWSTGFLSERLGTKGEQRILEFITISQSEEGLIGQLKIQNVTTQEYEARPIVIHGEQSSDGRFWPAGRLQVSNHQNGKWEDVHDSENTVGCPAKATLFSGMIVYGFYFRLDAFREFIGKATFGKVILENGDSVTFNLNSLSGPEVKER